MPFYEYECRKCKESITLMRAVRERDEPIECPVCGSRKVERKMSVFAAGAGGSSGSGASSCSSGFG